MTKPVDSVNQPGEIPADDVLELVHAVMHLVRSQQFRLPQDGNVTHMESKVLGFFARRPGATQSDLVAHAGRDKGQVARLINGLKERGLLQASVDEADRRSVRLQLTAAGQAAQQDLRRRSRKLSQAALKGLSAADKVQLVTLLDKVKANLEAH